MILKVIWYLVKNIVTSDKDLILHRIEQVMVFYKQGGKRKDYRWIHYHVTKFNAQLLQYKDQLNEVVVISLVHCMTDHYNNLLKNEQRLAAWNSLDNYCEKKKISSIINLEACELAEKIYELLTNDLLYLNNKQISQ